ncbi:MAG: hypothetical protein QNK35_07385 [Bacteroides sp.]|nr:hypothetical protein [Bacteroides sp.]
MKKIWFICAIILGLGSQLTGQTMVGLSKLEVIAAVKKDHRDFRKDDSVIKQHYNYLKYVNGSRTKTWIIYFTDGDTCKTSKVICDYSYLDKEVEEIESRYTRKGEYLWEYQLDSDTIQVEVIKQEWYFTIRETKKTS